MQLTFEAKSLNDEALAILFGPVKAPRFSVEFTSVMDVPAPTPGPTGKRPIYQSRKEWADLRRERRRLRNKKGRTITQHHTVYIPNAEVIVNGI